VVPSFLFKNDLPKRSTLLIEDATIITMDNQRRILKNGYVAIDNGMIVSVSKDERKKNNFRAEYRINARGAIVIPGLIDTHIHLAQALLRGAADDLSLVEWLYKRVWPLQGNFTERDGLVSSALCMLEMIKSGTTTFLESGLHKRYGNSGIAELLYKSGMRGAISKMVMDGKGYARASGIMHEGMIEDRDDCLKEAKELHKRWDGKDSGRIKVWLAARSLGAVSPGLYREISQVARELDTGITMHLNEVREDSEYSLHEYGMLPVMHMRECGILGKRTVFAHMVWATDDEISLLSNSGSSVSHCPSSNSKLASGIARVPEMMEKGVNVSLGCDGAPCNNTYDMIREMKIASLLQKARTLDPKALRAEKVLEMATVNGASALGLQNEIGSIEEGKRADLAIIRIENEHCIPSFNPISTLVYSCSGSDVETVIIDGRIIMLEREVMTLNEQRIIEEAMDASEKLLERAGINIKANDA
jgi:Cytosine deaminase and related metal-dependent hydrolases